MDSADFINRDEHSSFLGHRMGTVIPYAQTVTDCVPGASSVGQGDLPAAADHTHNVTLFQYTGAISDAVLLAAGFKEEDIKDGISALDITHNRVYFRISGTWRYAALT